jgi:DNA-binding MarR family transcriptional regulator
MTASHKLSRHSGKRAQRGAAENPMAATTGKVVQAPPKTPTRGVAEPVVQHLGVVIRWSRLKSFDMIANNAGVVVDRSGIVILTTLHRLGPMRMSDLAADIGLDRSTISRQVSAVVRAGYVARADDDNDARASLLTLTARGQAVRQKLATAWHDIVVGLLTDWPEQDVATFGRLLSRLTAQLQLREDVDE